MKCEFCGYIENGNVEVYKYERYGGMELCDRCVDKFDFINNGHDPNKTWKDEYSIRCGLGPFPVKEVYPNSNTECRTYGRKKSL